MSHRPYPPRDQLPVHISVLIDARKAKNHLNPLVNDRRYMGGVSTVGRAITADAVKSVGILIVLALHPSNGKSEKSGKFM